MLANKRKLKKRKHKQKRILMFFTVVGIVSILGGYLATTKIFQKEKYISPLSFALADSVSQDEKDITFLKKSLSEKQIEFKSVVASQSSYSISLKDGSEVILSSQKSMNSQISSLQFISQRLTMEGKLFSQLDLRFDKPVIIIRE